MNSARTTIHTATRRNLADHLPDLHAALEQQREFRLEQLDQIAEVAANCPPASDDVQDQVTGILEASAATALVEVEAALDRLGVGTYGACEGCDRHIPLERLEILPMSRFCMRCQHALETRSI